MSDLQYTKDSGIADIKVAELTLAQIRNFFREQENRAKAGEDADLSSADIIGDVLFEDLQLSELVHFVSVDAAQLEDLTPSQLRTLIDQVKEANPDFFAWRGRMITTLKTSAQTPPSPAKT